jgi:hypothetical protein
MKTIRLTWTLAVLAAFAAQGAAAAQAPTKAPHRPAQAAEPEPPALSFKGGKGKVLETKGYKGYTYVRVKMGRNEIWAAGPQTHVKKGDTVMLSPGSAMANFWSDAYQRGFDLIYFVSSIEVEGAKKAEATPSHALPEEAAPVSAGPISKAEGGKTVEEVILERKELQGKDVVVRARVSKAVAGVMDKNWLHLQDGTGGPGSNDLTVTTKDDVKAGDTVLVTGKVSIDRDFGSGYRYDVLLEDAKVTKE